MKITQEMVAAAVKQAVEDGIIPKYTSEENYIHNYKDNIFHSHIHQCIAFFGFP